MAAAEENFVVLDWLKDQPYFDVLHDDCALFLEAIQRKSASVLFLLLSLDNFVNMDEEDKVYFVYYFLEVAITIRSFNCVPVLLAHPSMTDEALNELSFTDLLLTFVQAKHEASVDALLKYFPKRYKNSSSAVVEAAWIGHLPTNKVLLNYVNPFEVKKSKPIRVAAHRGHLDLVKLLLDDGRVDVTEKDNYAFLIACEQGYESVVSLFLSHPYSRDKIDPSCLDNHAIRKAAELGRGPVVRLLLECPHVDPGAQDQYAYRHARGKYWGIEEMLKAHPKVDVNIFSQNKLWARLDSNRQTTLNSDVERK
eukprot:TRINITY_DN1851_c0_g1_i11.p1 TRINITY_DN1851_c0_g1~~TRINITY_DN1851_c0_g1_i11.p1  ORF type:complete len:309 (+),score=56.66 TRINITY_DN1851_c0_g1_i11:643-1569(+)